MKNAMAEEKNENKNLEELISLSLNWLGKIRYTFTVTSYIH